MYKRFIALVFLTCLCKLQGQVWTNLIDSVPYQSSLWINSSVKDTVTNTLYLGGFFHRFNQHTTKAIIQFNGTSFDTLQSGLDDFAWQYHSPTTVRSMQMFQGKLYVFGDFEKTGKYYCNNIGRWNGSSWDTVNFRPRGTVWFSDVYNNELYVAGFFDSIGGIRSNAVSKFDGTNWQDIGHPVSPNAVTAIKVFQGKLYMAGQVTEASSSANLSYFDGTKWVPWVGVSGDVAKYVYGMTVIDSMLYVYGRFNSIAGTNCRGLAAYNGKNWYGFGAGLSSSGWEIIQNVQKINGEIYAIGLFDKIEGLGNSNFNIKQSTNLAKYDGEKWCLISPPFDNELNGLIEYKNEMYLYGAIRKVGADSVYGFLRWNGGNTTIACSSTFAITMSTVGLKEFINFADLKIYPNPAREKLKIEYHAFERSGAKLSLINTLGQTIYEIGDVNDRQEIDLSHFSPGIYYLKIYNNSQQKVFKIVKE